MHESTNEHHAVIADSPPQQVEDGPAPPRQVLILGANGPSGRQTVQRGLDRGLAIHALTRRPEAFPIRHERLHVIGGDATDPSTIDAAVASCDAVISVIGTPFTWRPVEVYSTSARLLIAAMQHRGRRRLVVVTSGGVPANVRHGGILQHLTFLLTRKTFTRTVYDDMEEMERLVSASGLDWTIVRPPVLSDDPGTGYTDAENSIDGPCIAREDLATMLLDQLDDNHYLRKIAAVATPGLEVNVVKTIRREFLKR